MNLLITLTTHHTLPMKGHKIALKRAQKFTHKNTLRLALNLHEGYSRSGEEKDTCRNEEQYLLQLLIIDCSFFDFCTHHGKEFELQMETTSANVSFTLLLFKMGGFCRLYICHGDFRLNTLSFVNTHCRISLMLSLLLRVLRFE